MILIFKHKKTADKSTEKTLQILKSKLDEREVKSDIVSFEDIEFFIEKDDVRAIVAGRDLREYKTVFFRRVGEHRTYAHIIASIAKKNGIKFIDNLYGVTNEPSKLKQTAVLALNGISVPKTYFAYEYTDEKIARAIEFLKFPMVAKISVSRKGEGVFLAKDAKELEKIIKDNAEGVLLQEFITNEFDYRILVLGGNVACVEKRIRTDKDEFRNNVALGAREEFIPIESVAGHVLDLAVDAAKVADIQVAGVDVVLDPDGGAFIFEVNRAPGFTHDDLISNEIDSLADYLSGCDKR